VFQWRGPAPYFFVTTPEDCDAFLHVYLVPLKVALRRLYPTPRSNVVGYPTPRFNVVGYPTPRSNVVGYPTPRFSQLSSPVSPPPR
jgi:hypothetical protein